MRFANCFHTPMTASAACAEASSACASSARTSSAMMNTAAMILGAVFAASIIIALITAALGLSVRQAELLCKNMEREPAPEKPVTLEVNYVAECEKQLSKHLGRGVKIVNGKRKGRFELEFYGQEDLQVLLDALMKIQK